MTTDRAATLVVCALAAAIIAALVLAGWHADGGSFMEYVRKLTH